MTIQITYRLFQVSVIFITSILLSSLVLAQAKIDSSTTLFLASTNPVFQDLKPHEANSIFATYMKSVKERFNKKNNIEGNAESKVYSSIQDLKADLKRNAVNMLNITTEEYFEVKKQFDITACLSPIVSNSKFYQFVLITRSDKNINSLAELKNSRIASNIYNRRWLGDKWLSLKLVQQKLPDINNFFSSVDILEKETQSIYEVFFKRADCTLVRKSVFDTMCELNPQLKKSLIVLETSEHFVTSILAYYNKWPRLDLLKRVAEEISMYHTFTEGQQILKLYKVERLEWLNENDLDDTRKLLSEYNRLVNKKREQ